MKKSEKGSITIYVLFSCLLILAILVGVFMRNQSKITSQKRQQKIIEEQYNDDDKIDEIYENISSKYTIDEIAPTTPQISIIDGILGDNEWYRSDVTLQITAGIDNESGVNRTVYTLSGATTKTETTIDDGGKIIISEEGITTITVYTYDNAGNKSQDETFIIKKDSIIPNAPTVYTSYKILDNFSYTYNYYKTFTKGTGNVTCVNNGDARIDFTDTSSLKGIRGVMVSLSDLSVDTTIQVFYSTGGNYTEANSVRKAVEKGYSRTILDLPVGNYTKIRVDIGTATESYTIGALDLIANNEQIFSGMVRAYLSNSDTSGSGFWKYQYKTETGDWADTSEFCNINSSVNCTTYYRIVDKAGNVSSETALLMKRTS